MTRTPISQHLAPVVARVIALAAALAAGSLSAGCVLEEVDDLDTLHFSIATTPVGSYNVHLQDTVRFKPLEPGADADNGRALFGLAADLVTEDDSQAIFEGPSDAFNGTVVSNGRTCFTCHRGLDVGLGLPEPPLSDTVALTDTLFTGLDADAQGDPDGMHNLDQLGLVKIRPNRFNPVRPQTDPFRQVFFWRKSPRLLNAGLVNGFLHDGRGRTMFETARGALFSHTQDSDERFDDLFFASDGFGSDIEAFLFGQLSDPTLAALRDPSDPMFATLMSKPFYTVPVQSKSEKRGRKAFKRYCLSCHNVPNVFGNLSNVEPVGSGARTFEFPPMSPSVARTFDIGVAQRNLHNLRFTFDNGDGTFSPIVLPLVDGDGTVVQHTVTFDVGLAATTSRYEDLSRFKVPQLRGVKDAGPYFHDNSAATLVEVIDYFNSDDYNLSKDGSRFPIHMSTKERSDLLAFLLLL